MMARAEGFIETLRFMSPVFIHSQGLFAEEQPGMTELLLNQIGHDADPMNEHKYLDVS